MGFGTGGRVMATKADFIIISEPDHINLTCPRCDESFDVDWSELYQEYGEDLWMGGYGIVECTNCNEEIELGDYEYD